MRLTQFDYRLMKELQANPRESDRQIALKLGENEGRVRRRIQKLIESGVITPTAVPNLSKMGYNVTTFMGLQTELSKMQKIAERVARCTQVQFVCLSTGTYDILIWATFHSHKELADFLGNVLGKIPGIIRAEPIVQLKYVKLSPGWIQLDAEPPAVQSEQE